MSNRATGSEQRANWAVFRTVLFSFCQTIKHIEEFWDDKAEKKIKVQGFKTLNRVQNSRRNRLVFDEKHSESRFSLAGQLVCRHRWPTEVGTSELPGWNSFWDSVCCRFQKASGAAHPAPALALAPPPPRPWQRGRRF